jgi:hypothetical protein
LGKLGGALGSALLLGFGLTVAGGISEGVIRFTARMRPPKGGYSPVRGHRSREPINEGGYRDLEHTHEKPPGVRRVVFVGDSFTYGAGILLEDTYALRAGRALSASRGEPWEAVVLAVPGLDTGQEASIVEREAFTYAPDLLVLGYVLNDAEEADAAERRRAFDWTAREEAKRNPPFWRRSALLSLVADRLHAERENRERIENHLALYREGSSAFAAVKKSLQAMGARARAASVPFVVVIFPLFANPLDSRYPFAAIHDQVGEAARAAGATVVDTLPYYRDLDWHLLTVEGAADEHPNELAHRIAAQALLAGLEGVLGPPPALSKPR